MKVGFIGLGTMGASMAANLQKARARAGVHDIRREAATPHLAAGAMWADSPRGGRRGSATSSSPRCPARRRSRRWRSAPDGLLQGMQRGHGATSTCPPIRRRSCAGSHAAFEEKGVHLLDAPVSGGPKRRRERQARDLGRRRRARSSTATSRCSTPSATRRTTSGRSAPARSPSSCTTAPATSMQTALRRGVHAWASRPASSRWRCGRRCARARAAAGARSTGWPISSCRASTIRRPSRCAGAQGRVAGHRARARARRADAAGQSRARGPDRGARTAAGRERDSRVAMLLQEERAGVQIAVPAEKLREVLDS